jgi:hypothetical protein
MSEILSSECHFQREGRQDRPSRQWLPADLEPTKETYGGRFHDNHIRP